VRFALYETPYTPDKRTHHDALAKIETPDGKNNSVEGQNLKLKNGLGRMIDRRRQGERTRNKMKQVNFTHIFNLKLDAFQNLINLMPIE